MYRVIIADDEPLVRTGLYYLTDWNAMGFEVVAVLEDGRDVLDYLEKECVDVLLLDICMFQVSGLEVAAVVRKKYPQTRVVLLSGYQEFEYAREAMHQHVYEYLLKPVDDLKLQSVFMVIKAELDGEKHEEQLLKSFGMEEYEQVLAMIQSVSDAVMAEEEESWMLYAKLKPVLQDMPEEMRKILIRRLLNQLEDQLRQKDPQLAGEFEEQVRKIQFSKAEGTGSCPALIKLLVELNDSLMLRDLAVSNRPGTDDRIYMARKYINNHLSDEFTYRDVAEFVNISPRHFTRLFRSETGETFTDYVVRMRVEAAKRLLDENILKIKDIPAAVGYIDEKYFQRVFKKQVGCSLREYRNRKHEV